MQTKSSLLVIGLAFLCLLLNVSYAQDAVTEAAAITTADTEMEITADADLGPDDFDAPAAAAPAIEKDVILVLDNSGSMKKNDPDFLTSRAVTEFIDGLDTVTRIAIIIFDQDVSLAVPLTRITTASRVDVLQSLDRINYRGLFTDSPAAIERAIYELKNNSRDRARKLIIFMTDGIVDTGDAGVDLEKGKWLKDSLAPDAADADIKIFGIAFTEVADFQLIQSLAQTTGGEYYRALKAEDLHNVFEQIDTIINKPETPEVVTTPDTRPAVAAETPPIVITVPQPPVQAISREERVRSIIIIVAVVVLIITLFAILILLLRRSRGSKSAMQEADTEAYLNDIHGYTQQASYKLGTRPTMLGRVAGKDTELLDYIVIPESTIGRRHSLIEYKDFAYWIVDQGSINGTFVNDKPISSEERLKHGDKVRLHKFEFEFVMPEMVDAGMTVVSHTVMANQPAAAAVVDATALKSTLPGDENIDLPGVEDGDMDLDFDLTGGIDTPADVVDEDEEPTVIKDLDRESEAEPEFGSEDETLIPGTETDDQVCGTPDTPAPQAPETGQDSVASEDETLMPGEFDFPDEEATIRKEVDDEDDDDISLDNFIDLNNDDK